MRLSRASCVISLRIDSKVAMYVRPATAGEIAEVGEIRVAAYRAGGFLSADSQYAPMLRALGSDGSDLVLVAVTPAVGDPGGPAESAEAGLGQDGSQAERIIGTVMLQWWRQAGQTVRGPDEAEIRALAVRPDAQGTGIGGLLLRHVIDAARAASIRHLVLCTMAEMRAAQRLYERAGFVRVPERDFSPAAHTRLMVYGLRLG